MKWQLSELTDPKRFQGAIDVGDFTSEKLISQLTMMHRIRAVERLLAAHRKNGNIGGPVHLSVGQEAIAVGVSTFLRSSDRVFGGHRSHSHVLALGASVRKLFAEVLGKDTGLSKGMGGSMHLWDKPNGFYGSVPIVAGTVPLAVGAGLAAKLQRSSDIGVAYLGDGAIEEGVVLESLNLAKITNSPVLFVVENNLFASHMHISLRQPLPSTARFAEASDIAYEIVDGNNVVDVAKAADRLISKARSGQGPGFLEAITYRWYGHVDWRDDVDVGVNRSVEDVAQWRKRDPIARLEITLIESGIVTAGDLENIRLQMDGEVDEAWELAMNDPYPDNAALFDRVYCKNQ